MMSAEPNTNVQADGTQDEEEMEIVVEVTDDQQISLTAGEWGVILSVEEARLLGEALIDAADDAEGAVE
jgi:hypothetical protein